jgi:hypothetical protein
MDVGWHRRGLARLLTGLALLAGALAGCSAFGEASAPWGPAEPYAHKPLSENSVAVPVAGGEVGIVAGALEAAGYFCAQVRSNDPPRTAAGRSAQNTTQLPPRQQQQGLEAGGSNCYDPEQSPCTRPAGNQEVIYTTRARTDQILTASVGMGGGIHEPGQGLTSLAQWGLPRGLTFLTPGVRTAVEKQLTHTRLAGESFIGIVNGTVVVLDARKTTPQPDGTYAVHVNLTVGAPLVTVPGA